MTHSNHDTGQEVALAEQCARGDRRAFDELWERYRKRIFWFFYSRVNGDPNEAEDLAQEVFIRVWVALSRGTIVTSLTAWIYTIARNVAFDWASRRHDSNQSEPLEEHEDQPTSDPSVEDLVETGLTFEFFKRQLDEVLILNQNEPIEKKMGYLRKMAFICFYVDRLSIPQLQQELGMHARALGLIAPTLTQLNNWLSRGDILAALVRRLVLFHSDLLSTGIFECLNLLDIDNSELEIARSRWQKGMTLESIGQKTGRSTQEIATILERISLGLVPVITARIKKELHESRKD